MYKNAVGTSDGDGGGDGKGAGDGDGTGLGRSVNYRLGFKPSSPGNFLVDSTTGDMLAQPSTIGVRSTCCYAVFFISFSRL